MLRGLIRLIVIVIIVVAVGAFFLGYRWASPGRAPKAEAARPSAPTGTTGTVGEDRNRGREIGARVGETVAVGANAAERAMSNAQLTAKIKAKMALDDRVRALAIDVDTSGDVVTLSGTVRSDAERQRALQLARETDGVRSVIDRLEVR